MSKLILLIAFFIGMLCCTDHPSTTTNSTSEDTLNVIVSDSINHVDTTFCVE